MKTIQIDLFAFGELEQGMQSKALRNNVDYNLQDDWWSAVYEDAERVFLKITGFDVDRGAYCTGEWLSDANETARAVIREHGSETPTWLFAKEYLDATEETKVRQDAFLCGMLKAYQKILADEYNYLSGGEAIIAAFNGNEQLFTADGRRADRLEKLGTIVAG